MSAQAKAWEAWLASYEGLACNHEDESVLQQPYLQNRLWHAFHAGYAAATARQAAELRQIRRRHLNRPRTIR